MNGALKPPGRNPAGKVGMRKTYATVQRLSARMGAPISLAAVCALIVALGLAAPLQRPAAQAQTAAGAELRLDAFDKTYAPNEAPEGWTTRKFAPIFGNGERYFFQFVHNGADEHYLHLQSGRDNSFSVGREKLVPLQEWPVLEWQWKMGVLPKNGDVRVKERDDQAGDVCVVIRPSLTGFDSSLCYLFQDEGPKDTPIKSTKRDNAYHLILRTTAAGDPLREWLQERRNVLADYKRVFGREPSGEALIAVLIDSNDTESSAEAFYREIVMRKE